MSSDANFINTLTSKEIDNLFNTIEVCEKNGLIYIQGIGGNNPFAYTVDNFKYQLPEIIFRIAPTSVRGNLTTDVARMLRNNEIEIGVPFIYRDQYFDKKGLQHKLILRSGDPEEIKNIPVAVLYAKKNFKTISSTLVLEFEDGSSVFIN